MIIKIKNLKLKTIIGIYDFEQSIDREIIINAKIKTNHTKSLESDDIKDAIDYDQITNKIKNIVKNNRYKLIEKLTQAIMDEIMQDTRITECKLEIDKVGAVEDLESFSITITQSR